MAQWGDCSGRGRGKCLLEVLWQRVVRVEEVVELDMFRSSVEVGVADEQKAVVQVMKVALLGRPFAGGAYGVHTHLRQWNHRVHRPGVEVEMECR